jgi:hypothetical protein
VEVARLADTLAPPLKLKVEGWRQVKPLQTSAQSVKFVIPSDWKIGVYACRVSSGGKTSEPVLVNAPDPWWMQGDGGESASPGGWLRLFGKCLSFGGAVQVALKGADGEVRLLKPKQADCWSLWVELPAGLKPGAYGVQVHNGMGGDATWRSAGTLTVAAPEAWTTDVFNVRDFGKDADKAVRAALAKAENNGGGVVYFPRGRYGLKGELVLPPGTVLRGEGMELVNLYWPDMEKTPIQLISGPRFGLEGLTLYCQNHKNVVTDQDGSVGTFLRRVRIRANCYFMIEDARKESRGRKGPASHRECGSAVWLRGRNFEVTDCDIYASNYALHIDKAKAGLIARNRFLYGGRGYSIENTDRLIFEDNLVCGNDLLAIGNDITTFYTNYCRNIYYAHNQVRQMFGADREMMTLDAGGGAYFGKVVSVSGTHVTLAADPTYKDYTPRPHTDWTGAAFMILDGAGAGQWRQVTRNAGREWEVDRPWVIPPDDTSLISIAPHRGRHLFIGNTFEDGGAFQLYGAALDTIVAGNKGARMDGFFAWGLNPHGWGWQPAWFCQFLDNEILEGNGYGGPSAFIGGFTSNNNAVYAGPLARGLIFRRNVLHNNARIRVAGTTADAVVEHCTVQHSDLGIEVGGETQGIVLRDNKLEDVTKPLTGDGAANALVIATPNE